MMSGQPPSPRSLATFKQARARFKVAFPNAKLPCVGGHGVTITFGEQEDQEDD